MEINPFKTYQQAYALYAQHQVLCVELFCALRSLHVPACAAVLLCQYSVPLERGLELTPCMPILETVKDYRDEMQLLHVEGMNLIQAANLQVSLAMRRPAPRPDLRPPSPKPKFV